MSYTYITIVYVGCEQLVFFFLEGILSGNSHKLHGYHVMEMN